MYLIVPSIPSLHRILPDHRNTLKIHAFALPIQMHHNYNINRHVIIINHI